jgi:nucleotide-binding universal stress UspA family protein
LQLERASSQLAQAGASVQPVLRHGSAKEAFVKLTRELGPELVVLGAPRHGLWECGLRGCTACWVTKHVPCTVVVVRDEPARASR